MNHGEEPDLKTNRGDFFFLCRRAPERMVSTVVELCLTRLPEKMGIAPEDIQVLTPTRKGECGTVNLNRRLQAALNPPQPSKKSAGPRQERKAVWGPRIPGGRPGDADQK